MLKCVRLKNFKLQEDTSIEAAPITVFMGPNNSGKSSIFQALLALKQAATRPAPSGHLFLQPAQRQQISEGAPFLFPPDQLIDIGEFRDVVRHAQSEVEIGVSGVVASPKPLPSLGPVDVSFEVGIQDNTLARQQGSLQCPVGRF